VQVFPVFFDLTQRPCLVVGGGNVGCDKALALVAAGADVLVVDPSPSAPAVSLATVEGRLGVATRPFRDEDCRGRVLVFACTDDDGVNAAVACAAASLGIPCCRADGGGDFSTGALLRRGEVCVAVSSAGTSPALAIEVRDRIAAVVGDDIADAARLLGGLRERLRASVAGAATRTEALRGNLTRDLLEALRSGQHDRAKSLVNDAYEAARRADPQEAARGSRCTR